MRKIDIGTSLFAVLAAASCCASAQDQRAIREKLESQYFLTQPTADKTDIVTAGSILVLQKNSLLMVPTFSSSPCTNTYKDGRISQGGLSKITAFSKHLSKLAQTAPESRTFVAGEKMWVTKIDATQDGVYFELFTDVFGDVRYKTMVKFPFAKGPLPAADQVARTVSEVFKVQPRDAGDYGQQQPPQQAPARSAEAIPEQPPAPVAPPQQPAADPTPAPVAAPPPPVGDTPPEPLKLGQTTEQVIAILGQPQKIANLGTKQIYFYKDLKVTFVDKKVTDIQ